ncbi:[NiFe]-hydrogenase assembly chaperone HybE [Mesosutterella sp. OilRF-GAM-744-9]|uniref:[NiFe]-hydrogenase assembly chaperone HybE n=1 Tax=Mesosutterella porci TaxID=2915351 RepID=A0ABS9MTU5_9BURK|nr:[NiFe]-hydrogenase assembly chaperone HybE [Mesosutterella sp. oilRF-744-WT-GAM-9]MCG5031418.1 [NiFe]-hydrogenase assembly chaperone HybE [Mesosutterella sp. oilRF-744-WT-GAM-9]MCI6530331.1 [NiFe]-hydrogenase assembly chaperone HybE [Mesosutterella sp.]
MTDKAAEPVRPRVRVRVFRESPEKFFLAGFRKIANTRMKGVPICNPKLHVSTLPFRLVNGQWIGGVVTPWSLLVIRACATPASWERIAETKVGSIELPGGDFSFMCVRDLEMGEYQSCSLLSPTWEVGDQETAEAVVRISLETMLTAPDRQEADASGQQACGAPRAGSARAADPSRLSRRDFFTRPARSEAPAGRPSDSDSGDTP